MASITFGNLDDDVTYRLCLRVAHSGRSTEKEVRLILRMPSGASHHPSTEARRYGPREVYLSLKASVDCFCAGATK